MNTPLWHTAREVDGDKLLESLEQKFPATMNQWLHGETATLEHVFDWHSKPPTESPIAQTIVEMTESKLEINYFHARHP